MVHYDEEDRNGKNSSELVYMRKFEAEFSHVTNDIGIQESEAMRLALLLLSDIDNATMEKNDDFFMDAISDIESPAPVPTATAFKRRADEIVTACLKLQSLVRTSKQSFQEAAHNAEKRWNTQRASFLKQRLSEAPWNGPPTNLVVALSDVYEAIRMFEKQADGGTQAKWEAPSTFERVTTKYWVEHEQMEKLLLACVKEAPLLVYGQSNRLTSQNADPDSLERDMLWESLASEISSVYFDSPRMSMYKRRIAREEGAKLFRVRWYGKKPKGNEPIYLELKTHHEKWVNTSSVKERVTILEKHMPCFLERIHWNFKEAKSIVVAGNPKLKGTALDDAVHLLIRMHSLVVDEDLRPCVRTAYSRAAFQSPSSNALRLTIDRNITIYDEAGAPKGAWCRSDDAFTDPSTYKRLPVSVFEVKLAGSEMPQAITSLLDDGTIVESVKFSKFLTGAGAFNFSKVKTLPYWAEHPSFRSMMTANEGKDLVKTRSSRGASSPPPSKMARQSVLLQKQRGPSSKLSDTAPSEESREVNSSYSRNETPSKTKGRSFSLFGLCCTRPASKAIAPQKPARVEPKSYFANERTFIQWVSASLWLVTISALLLEREQDGTSHLTITGIALSSGAVLVAVYATYVYFRRIRLMRSGTPRGYADHLAPLLLAGSVIIGVVVLLAQKSKNVSSSMSQNDVVILTPEQGRCFLHSNMGISTLQYEPSDLVIDDERNMLLAASLDRIVGHSTVNPEEGVKVLGRFPGADMEALVSANGRLFALSEAAEGDASGLLELEWQEDGSLELLWRWEIDANIEDIGEGMAYMTDPDGDGSLFIDTGTSIDLYNLPPSSIPPGIGPDSFRLNKQDSLNKKLLIDGLLDGKIASMFGFRGILYVLHDNDGVLRSWDVTRGEMVAEMPLPLVGNVGFEKQWEGIAIETNNGSFAPFSSDGNVSSSFVPLDPSSSRGILFYTAYSDLIVHLAMDTPPQVWSFAVDEGDVPGQLLFPACAGIN